MSDIQILTGISILISGYSQLRCGLSAYHWQVVVYLAWFSSLTHLSCLTMLQNYLYQRPTQRLLRLLGMAITIVMLIYALKPTGNFDWIEQSNEVSQLDPAPGSYAICFFQLEVARSSSSYGSMMISISLLVFAFIQRVVRLHRSLSIDIFQKLTHKISKFSRFRLKKIYEWCDVDAKPWSLKRLLVYRPLLALFLVIRVTSDVWSSMVLEVRIIFNLYKRMVRLIHLRLTGLVARSCICLGLHSPRGYTQILWNRFR
jgi:hypothetical protein